VLLNLAGNAVKFTGTGVVTLRVSTVRGEHPVPLFRFAVEDTGPGIPVDRVDHLFEAFTQADVSTTRRFGGTGLGLAISQRLVTGMGGTIRAESEVGHGSTFHFRIPLPPDVGARVVMPPPLTRPSAALVAVPDDRAEAVLLRDLRALGVAAYATRDPGKARERIAQGNADTPLRVIVVDDARWDHPQWAGVVRPSRGDAPLPPIIRLGYRSPSRPDSSATTLESTLLVKPYRLSRLIASLAEVGVLDAVRPARPAEDEDAPGRGERVLIVDDNAVNLRVARRIVESLGYVAETATNGREAVERALGERFDVILMDCQMPVLDGFDAAAEIRNREVGRRVPIIALTAAALEEDRRRSLEAGMDEFLAKPVRRHDMAGAIARALKSAPSA
jgi:CheY-like chemotaxis protein